MSAPVETEAEALERYSAMLDGFVVQLQEAFRRPRLGVVEADIERLRSWAKVSRWLAEDARRDDR